VEFVAAGRTFLLSGGRFGANQHLWIILTDPDRKARQVVAAMIVTSRQHTDKTVTLKRGEHPFIEHDSNVDFGGAVLVRVESFYQAMHDGQCHIHQDVSAAVLETVRRGLLTSQETVHFISEYCRPLFQDLLREDPE